MNKRMWMLLGLAAGLYLWSVWPATTIMPRSMLLWRLSAALPKTEPKTDWEKRGKYLVTVSGCAMCHTPYTWTGPLGSRAFQGGMRVRWNNDLRERVAFNLTPDPDTGIGRWTEEDFTMAMKTGTYPDGHAAHWQAMPWDMHSNFSLDDMRAMFRYLKSLPPQKQKSPRPLHGPLPKADTFYFGG